MYNDSTSITRIDDDDDGLVFCVPFNIKSYRDERVMGSMQYSAYVEAI